MTTQHLPAIQRLRRMNAHAWRPRPRVSSPDWIARRVRLTEEYEGSRGAYNFAARPWWREVVEAMALPTTRNVRLKASTQTGKTLSLLAMILYLADTAPASAMAVLPDQAAAIELDRKSVV